LGRELSSRRFKPNFPLAGKVPGKSKGSKKGRDLKFIENNLQTIL